ncbi:MAG: MGMT family protein [Chloroflexi bacterium]|nr:MGMT family protein [Chloroflexota bacterium]
MTLPCSSERESLDALGGIHGATRNDASFANLTQRLERYYAGDRVAFDDVTIDLDRATPFQRSVLETVRAIPRGETRSYGEVAMLAGRPGAARAVGATMASNPVCVIVPCHRVIGSSGSLTGFGGGLEMKQRMLALEGVRLAKAA